MKIKIINPNTTQSMTESIENLACRVARSDTQVWAVTPASGPDSIECYVDEYLAVPGVSCRSSGENITIFKVP